MRRREFTLLLGGTMALTALPSKAQQLAKVPRIAFLTTTSPSGSPATKSFVEGLRDLGYVEGRNIAIEWRWGYGSTERFPEFADEVVRLNVDVILAANTAAGFAAQKATKTIPIVIPTMEEPVGNGFVMSLARPGGNITGLSLQTPDLQSKRVQLFKEAVPTVSRIAVLVDVAGRPLVRQTEMNAVEAAAQALSIQLQPLVEVQSPGELAQAFATVTGEGADGVFAVGGTMFFANRAQLAEQALKSRVPMMCDLRPQVEAGCLMSYGGSITEVFRRAAALVDRILRGAAPAELPVEQPTKFELVINLKTAKAIGVTIPPLLLARADEVIE
jgi:putative tryptophan/tyrosine transport system substrate-binding protein